jgi:Integrase core domain
LNKTLFNSLAHARAALATWQVDHNTVRPHSSLGNLRPVEYANRSSPASQRGGSLRAIGGYASHPVAKWRGRLYCTWMRTGAHVTPFEGSVERDVAFVA